MLHWITEEDENGLKRWGRWIEISHWGLFCTGSQPYYVYPNYFERAFVTYLGSVGAMTEAEYEVLLTRIAMIIDPIASTIPDDLSPTERDLWNERRGGRQGVAGQKARQILALMAQ